MQRRQYQPRYHSDGQHSVVSDRRESLVDMGTTTEVLRDSIARIIVELERIEHHLATAAVEPPEPFSCQFVTGLPTGASLTDAPDSGTADRGLVESATAIPLGSGDRLLFIEDVTAWLEVPVETLRSWRQNGKGPRSAKVGARVRYREADVQAWIDVQMEQNR